MMAKNILIMAIFQVAVSSKITVVQRQKDMIYCNGTVLEIHLPYWTVCAEICSRMSTCKSFNFKEIAKSCQINNEAPDGGSSLVINSPTNSFMEASAMSEDLAGNCNTHNCKSEEMCLEEPSGFSCVQLLDLRNDCKENWVSFNGHCYFLGTTMIYWNDAQIDCQMRGSNLVTINNECEQQWLKKIATDVIQTNIWIGANDLGTEGQWKWVSDNSLVDGSYSAWGTGEPNDNLAIENCACLFKPFSYKWIDTDCTETYSYVCEINI